MSGIITKVFRLPVQFPLIRGMVSYAIIWPTCSVVQEYLEHGTTLENADRSRAARYGIFGTFFMAPVFYNWMKYTSRFFKSKTLSTAITRAVIEQVSYSPLAMAYFFFGMSALEGKSFNDCVDEVREKFWPTYKIGAIFWPTAQTINFYFVSEKNRIVFVSAASFVWTVYLAHVKSRNKIIESVIDEIDLSEEINIQQQQNQQRQQQDIKTHARNPEG
ncbi:Mpv17-like protein [Papilio machaon]|uniref:Mpv17-like protein n=1 Tax=Papilio machaon TaxID=76193 RepID=A0A0N1IJD6_PAPMA|nr:Mpv17-like protein [Papilio machaon]